MLREKRDSWSDNKTGVSADKLLELSRVFQKEQAMSLKVNKTSSRENHEKKQRSVVDLKILVLFK